MPTPKIAKRGPFVLKETVGMRFFCTCGQSKAQPFCDGAHKGSEFSPLKVDLTEARTVAWCGCKHSKGLPYCDGSHSRLG